MICHKTKPNQTKQNKTKQKQNKTNQSLNECTHKLSRWMTVKNISLEIVVRLLFLKLISEKVVLWKEIPYLSKFQFVFYLYCVFVVDFIHRWNFSWLNKAPTILARSLKLCNAEPSLCRDWWTLRNNPYTRLREAL